MSPRKKSKLKRKPVKIDYPEVPTKTWIPPDLRAKKIIKPPQHAYTKPAGMDQKLKISSLKKMWHFFEIIGTRAVLTGGHSQFGKKYALKTRGFQGPANAVVAITFSQMFEMPRWKSYYLDKILDIGDRLYLDSRKHLKDPHQEVISLLEVHKSFYIGNERISVDIRRDGIIKGSAVPTDNDPFDNALKTFFDKDFSCAIMYQKRCYALWKQGSDYFLFNPMECNQAGLPWTGIPSLGVAALTKFFSLKSVVAYLAACALLKKGEFSIIPVQVQRVVHINTKYPQCLQDANLEVAPTASHDILTSDGQHSTKRCAELKNIVEKKKQGEESEDESSVADGNAQDNVVKSNKDKETKVPMIEKSRPEPVSFYICVSPNRMTILRAATHQANPRFSKYRGQQSFANCIAAITMLHIHKSKLWTTKVMEEILKTAEVIHHDTLKTMTGDHAMKVTDICKKITIDGLNFTSVIEEYTAVGRLNSDKEDVSDLTQALTQVMSDNDALIISGPLIVAFWVEENMFYMYDANERDAKGLSVTRDTKVSTGTPGTACCTCFNMIKDMVTVYMANLKRDQRRDPFLLSKVEMKDYVEEPLDWHNFKALRQDKWVLRGSFHQNDLRFSSKLRGTQCTSMAAMFLGYVQLKKVEEWTTELVDEIITDGNNYYGTCLKALKETGKFMNRLLMATELQTRIPIADKILILNLEEMVVYGTLSCVGNVDFGWVFPQGIKFFFEENDFGILTCSNLSIAIFKVDDAFYVADSHARNEQGYFSHSGTAVVIRHLTTDAMATSLETNYSGSVDKTYNIHRVTYEIWDSSEDGVVKPPLHNYTAVNNNTAILRAGLSQDCPVKFPLTAGKQTVPMLIAALGMIKLSPPATWTVDIIEEVLNVGNNFYKRCIDQFYKEHEKPSDEESPAGSQDFVAMDPAEGEEGGDNPHGVTFDDDQVVPPKYERPTDAITTENMLTNFTIGINNFTVEFDEIIEGTADDIKTTLEQFFQEADIPEEDQRELILDSKALTVVVWRDKDLYYCFDPKSRDEKGQVYGKDEWSLVPEEPVEEEQVEGEDNFNQDDNVIQITDPNPTSEFNMAMIDNPPSEGPNQQPPNIQPAVDLNAPIVTEETIGTDEHGGQGEDGQREESPLEEEIELPPKHSESYWKRQEIDGRAYVMWFTELADLINFIVENIPPKQRDQPLHIKHVQIANAINVKDVYDPESGPKESKEDGDWHNFKEVMHGYWILRGGTTFKSLIFPVSNRGRQYIANCFTAASYLRLFAASKFQASTIDAILKYGDKLHTSTRRVRKSALEGNKELALTCEEIEMILDGETLEVNDVVKKFCIGNYSITIKVEMKFVTGELYQDNPEILTLHDALEGFFGLGSRYGILQAKGIYLCFCRQAGAYLLFDPDSRGPSGHKSSAGDACFTRFLRLDNMCNVIVENLAIEGSNIFYIHSLQIQMDNCKRVVKVDETPATVELTKASCLRTITPGKSIINGTLCIDSSPYSKFEKQQAAPVNLVALAMTLIHRSENWTALIIDEIVRIGSAIYQDVMNANVEDFNPWEQRMSIYIAPTEFKIGKINVSCELRNNDQRGVVDIKLANVQNLRCGLELFFEENTHGIISTYDLLVAIWKPEGQDKIYMFDGSSRGSGGMPTVNGGACLLIFDTPKLLSDHFVSLTPDFGRKGAYVIVPVEIVVAVAGKKKTSKKTVSKEQKEALELHRRKEAERVKHLGRHHFYESPMDKMAILRGDRSENSKNYSPNSRGNQDLTNCVVAYIMDKMLPVYKWTYAVINNVLNIGDQLYKDSVVMYNPTGPKFGAEALCRSVVVANCKVKLAIGKPVMANEFTIHNVIKSLEVYFGSRSFCILNVADYWLGLFLKNGQYYIFDPQDVDIHGRRIEPLGSGTAVLMRFDQLPTMVEHMVRNLRCEMNAFYVLVIAIKQLDKIKK